MRVWNTSSKIVLTKELASLYAISRCSKSNMLFGVLSKMCLETKKEVRASRAKALSPLDIGRFSVKDLWM